MGYRQLPDRGQNRDALPSLLDGRLSENVPEAQPNSSPVSVEQTAEPPYRFRRAIFSLRRR